MEVEAYSDAFQCSVCLQLPEAEIWSCKNGHILCDPCRRSWAKPCPTCSDGMVNTRNRGLEQVRDVSEVVCQCSARVAARDLPAHIRGCVHAPVQCPVLQTCLPFMLDSLLDHMRRVHADVQLVVINFEEVNASNDISILAALSPSFTPRHLARFVFVPSDEPLHIFFKCGIAMFPMHVLFDQDGMHTSWFKIPSPVAVVLRWDDRVVASVDVVVDDPWRKALQAPGSVTVTIAV